MHERLAALPVVSLGMGATAREANTQVGRRRGLAGLDRLTAADALWLPHCRSVHTIGMRCALDLFWLGADGAVLRVDRAVPPRRLRTCLRARSVLEIPVAD